MKKTIKRSQEDINLIDDLGVRLHAAELKGLKTQKEYERVLADAAYLRMHKVTQYGEERYDDPDIEVQLWMTYCDVWRKFSRLRMLIKNVIHNKDVVSLNKLRSDYQDLLNYGAMGVQIIDRLELIRKVQKEKEKQADEKK
jgi:hypothetical protein